MPEEQEDSLLELEDLVDAGADRVIYEVNSHTDKASADVSKFSGVTIVALLALVLSNAIWAVFTYNAFAADTKQRLVLQENRRVQCQLYDTIETAKGGHRYDMVCY